MRLQGISNGLEHTVTAGTKESPESWKRRSQVRLPSAEEAQRLSTAYFKHIHPQYPFLHRPTFDTWEREYVNQMQE